MRAWLGLGILGLALTLTGVAAATSLEDGRNGPLPLSKLEVDCSPLIIAPLAAVGELASRIQTPDAVAGAPALQRQDLAQFETLITYSLQNRLLFSGLSLALGFHAMLLVFRWRIYAERLRQRFDMERSIYDAMTRLSLEPELFETSMNEALARVEKVFEFRSAYLMRLDPATWTIGETYCGRGTGDVPAQLVQDFVSELRLKDGAFSDLTLWRYSQRPLWRHIIPRLRYGRFPLAVASIVMRQGKQAVVLVAECRQVRGKVPDSGILRVTTDLLAQAIEKHARLAELDELKRRLEEAHRLEAVATFAGSIAHDFNNLLAVIMGYAEMAIDGLGPRSTIHNYVENIIEAGTQTQKLIDQILAFSRTRNLAKPFELIEAIAETLPVLYLCVPKGVRLRVDLPDSALVIAGSIIELQQTLVNLCKNAGEALQGKGEVALVVEAIMLQEPLLLSHGQLPPGRYVRIAVSDDGPGIAAEHLSRIFEPFFSTKTDNGGAGLGLSVVHGTVRSLNGAINVRSRLGAGACFELFFPVLEEEELLLVAPYELPGVQMGNGELVAIVDSIEASRSRWEEKLAVVGYEPAAFETMQALANWCYRTGVKPDVVLVDPQGEDDAARNRDVAALSEACWIYVCEMYASPPTGWMPTSRRMVLRKPVSQQSLASALDGLLGVVPVSRPVVQQTASAMTET